MKKIEAINLITQTLEENFDRDNFRRLIVNVFKDYKEPSTRIVRSKYIKSAYTPYIDHYERLATYEDKKKRVIDAVIVYLKNPSTFTARTRQRNFILDYIKQRHKDGVLVAFVHNNKKDWRFSFVMLEMDIKRDETGHIKDVEKITSAIRSSFLVGANENSHTAQKQLLPLLESVDSPRFEEIEQAFSVERVTKEFFEKYRDLFYRTEEALQEILKNNPSIEDEFIQKEISTTDFAKKLLGQIVFLYFVQKKGWLGVPRDGKWGEGSKQFLRTLFKEEVISYKNFFNEILEPLFYEALADDRGKSAYWSKFDCRIPFLNGGLFEPLQGYAWEKTDIELPNDLFSNSRETKDGDVGNGILDVFDRFNFTVKEDEPLETEVAIDPEMLGKVFENLLEVKDRKSKGTYYTPREIVHYMCQESLINYLDTELGNAVSQDDIRILIKNGSSIVEYEEAKQNGVKSYDSKKFLKIPKTIIDNSEIIDGKLKDIKICDPAIGSGAFPVGMMNEIVNARNILTTFISNKGDRTPYYFKRYAIANSLYGVDIDQGAVEIAKLRLWLSLIVDEESMDHIRPLPNLDYKIMQGNSLLEEYEGVKLIDERFFEDNDQREKETAELKEQQSVLQKEFMGLYSKNKLTKDKENEINKRMESINKRLKELKKPIPKEENQDLFGTADKKKEMAKRLLDLQKQFFETAGRTDKPKLKDQIEELSWELIEETLKQEGKESKLKEIEKFKKSNTKPFFLWKLHFAEVFQEKGGFDVVIANPPYVNIANISQKDRESYKRVSMITKNKVDLYAYFIELGIKIQKSNGVLCYITPNTWKATSSFSKLRELIFTECTVKKIVELGDETFEATVKPIIIILQRQRHENYTFAIYNNKFKIFNNIDVLNIRASRDFVVDTLSSKKVKAVLAKIEAKSIPLLSICKFTRGIKTSNDKRFITRLPKGKDMYKVIRGKNVKKYSFNWEGEYIWYRPDLMREKVGSVPHNNQLFNISEKIILQRISKGLVACLDIEETFTLDTCLVSDVRTLDNKYSLKYLISLINSSLLDFWFQRKFILPTVSGYELHQLPIKDVSKEKQKPFVDLVKEILSYTQAPNYLKSEAKQIQVNGLKKRIDQMVYKLYGLTEEEIEIVEGGNKDET